ncbi:MAG: RNA-binding domain-containing protein [Candidatus Thermoplasmatota archaeon]
MPAPTAEAPLRYHWLRLRAVAHPTEAVEKVAAAVRFVAGVDAAPQETILETHHGLPQHVLEVALERSRDVRDLLGRLLALPGARDKLRAELEARVDDDGLFFVRFDKQEAYAGRLVVTSSEDCVQIRLKTESYPSGRAAAIRDLTRLLESGKP